MTERRIVAMACSPRWIKASEMPETQRDGLPRFEIDAYNGGAINLGWGIPVVVDLAGMELPSQTLPVQYQHEMDCGVGHTTQITITESQLTASGVISRGTDEAEEIAASARNGFPWQASIGASVMKVEEVAAGSSAQANGQTFAGPVAIVRACTLREISFVEAGADSTTSAKIAAKATQEHSMDLKTRKATLLAAHPECEAVIMAGLVDGLDDVEIVAGIEAAAVKAQREAEEAEIASLRASSTAAAAEIETMKAQIAAKDAEIADLKVKIEAAAKHKAGIPADPGAANSDQQSVLAADEFHRMSAKQRAAYFQKNPNAKVV